METDNILLVVAVIAVVVSLVGAGITYSYINAFKSRMTGFATSGGWINLTVEENVAINFSYAMINWSSGMVDDGESSALLDTSNQTDANVTNGNWTGNHNGLVIENIGNKNVTLALHAAQNETAMIGGSSGGGPRLLWRLKANETGSCVWNDTSVYNWTWLDVNTSSQLVCDYFNYIDSIDEFKIHIFAQIPSDSKTGDLGNTITATFAAAT